MKRRGKFRFDFSWYVHEWTFTSLNLDVTLQLKKEIDLARWLRIKVCVFWLDLEFMVEGEKDVSEEADF